MTILPIRTILRGNPIDPLQQPDPAELTRWLEDLESRIAAGVAYFEDTLADLNAVSAPEQGAIAFVIDDGANSGVYRRGSSSWSKTAALPVGFSLGALGSAALSETTDFASASQGEKADSAVQPDALGPFAPSAKTRIGRADIEDMAAGRILMRPVDADTGPPQSATASQAKAALGLSNVNDTSDANKPVSTAQAISDKAALSLDRDNGLRVDYVTGRSAQVVGGALTTADSVSSFGTFARASAAYRATPAGLIDSVAAGTPLRQKDGVFFGASRSNRLPPDFSGFSVVGGALSAGSGLGDAASYVFTEDAGDSFHRMLETGSFLAYTTGVPFTFGVALKALGREQVTLLAGSAGNYHGITVNLRTGKAVSTTGTAVKRNPMKLQDGFWWVELSFIPTADAASGYIYIDLVKGIQTTYPGNGGPAFEIALPAGNLGTRAILPPSAGTRSLDTHEIDVAGLIEASEGSLRLKLGPSSDGGTSNRVAANLSGGTGSLVVRNGFDGRGDIDVAISDGTTTTVIRAPAVMTDGMHDILVTWSADAVELWIDGVCHGRVEDAPVLVAPTTLRVGSGTASANAWDGVIGRVELYSEALAAVDLMGIGKVPSLAVVEDGAGNGQIMVDGKFYLTALGDNRGPTVDADARVIRWRRSWGGVTYAEAMPIDIRTPIARATYTTLATILDFGQSLAQGYDALPILHADAVLPRRAVSGVNGPRVLSASAIANLSDTAQPGDLVDLREVAGGAGGETSASQAALSYAAIGFSNAAIYAANAAIGSATVDQLRGAPSLMLERAWARALWLSYRTGIDLLPLVLAWSQGHSNSADSEATYLGRLQGFYDDIGAPFWAMAEAWQEAEQGVSLHPFAMLMRQVSVPVAENVALAQWAFCADAGRNVIASCPEFLFETTDDAYSVDPEAGVDGDTIHLSAAAMAWRGAYDALAWDAWLDGISHEPLGPVSASRSDTAVTVTFNTSAPNMVMPLVLDSGDVSNPGDYGFAFTVDGVAQTISSVVVNGSNQVVITLAGTPPAGVEKVEIGKTSETGQAQGPSRSIRNCLRDSRATTVTVDGVSRTLFNHCWNSYVAVS